MTAFRVVEPYQVHHDGVTYGPGETVEADPDDARVWVASGWVEESTAKPPPKRSRRS